MSPIGCDWWNMNSLNAPAGNVVRHLLSGRTRCGARRAVWDFSKPYPTARVPGAAGWVAIDEFEDLFHVFRSLKRDM